MIGIALLLILLGLAIKNGKMYFLMAGYNTMTKDEKAKIDVEGIAKVFRNTMFGMALIVVLGSLVSYWKEDPKIEVYAVVLSSVIGIPYLLIESNSKRYKKDL